LGFCPRLRWESLQLTGESKGGKDREGNGKGRERGNEGRERRGGREGRKGRNLPCQ